MEMNPDGTPTPWHARGTAVTPATFRKHLDDIQERFEVLGPEALLDASIPEGGVVLTFDDAAPELSDLILPEMLRRGLRAALFPVTSVFEGKTYAVDRFYDAVNQCNGKEFHYPDYNGTIGTTLLTPSEVRRIVRSNLKRRIVGLGDKGHDIVDEIVQLNGIRETISATDTANSIHDANQHGWLIGLHGHDHLSFTLHDDNAVWDDLRRARSVLQAQGFEPTPIIAATDGRMPRGPVDNDFHDCNFLSIAQAFDGKGVVIPFQERWLVPPRQSAIKEASENGSIESVEQHEEGKWHDGRPEGDWAEIILDTTWIIELSPFRTKKNRALHYARRKKDGKQGVLKVHELQVLDEAEFVREIQHLEESQGDGVVKLLEHGTIGGWGVDGRKVLAYITERLQPMPKLMTPVDALLTWRKMVYTIARMNKIGFVHCDVKPGNILVDEGGFPYLIDFAESVRIGDSASRDKVVRQEDVYNLGKLLHRLVTGDRVYVLPSERVLAQQYPDDANGEIKRTILAMCDPDYRERPSIEELIEMSSFLCSHLVRLGASS
jgi:peptidoglycan/xylan/chitin deacetylase (PgdA/CDA1 family)